MTPDCQWLRIKSWIGTKHLAFCIIGFVARLTRRVSLVEQELLTLPEHLILTPVYSGVRVTRSLALYVCFVGLWLSFCTFSFGHCVVCSSKYGFWLPLLYLQTLPILFRNLQKRFLTSNSPNTHPLWSKGRISALLLVILSTGKSLMSTKGRAVGWSLKTVNLTHRYIPLVIFSNNTSSVASGAGTPYPSGAPGLTSGF